MGASLERLLRRSVMASADIVVCLVSALVSIYMVDSSLAFYHTRFWGIVTLILLQTV